MNLIFDYNHLAYRCFCVNDTLVNSEGQKTGVSFGVLRSLRALCDKFKPDRVIFCMDSGSSFRKSIIESYKGSRAKNRDPDQKKDYYEQLSNTVELLTSLGVPVVKYTGLEADDLCALCSKLIYPSNHNVIVSGDKDLLQLVDDHTDYYYPFYEKLVSLSGTQFSGGFSSDDFSKVWSKNEIVHPEVFTLRTEKCDKSIQFNKWILYRSLVGDSSDELTGIKGIGPGTAQKIVEVCGSVDEVIQQKDSFTFLNKRQKEALTLEELKLQYNIINLQLVCSFPQIDSVVESLKDQSKCASRNMDLFKQFITKYQFNSILIELNQFIRNIPNQQ